MDTRGLDHVTGCSKHGNTGMLELCGTEPGEGLIRSHLGKTEGVKVLGRGGGTANTFKISRKGSGDLYTMQD